MLRSKDSLTCYIWDHRNRLVRVVDNGKSVEYEYDYQNCLVRRNDELFVHDGWQVACSLKNGRIAHRYLWGAMQDELLAMDDAWTLRDHLNTVRNVIDMNGKAISHLEYNAFGKLVSSTGEKLPFRYTGKMFDDTIGLQWNINRWYDADVGRWVSEDSIGFEGKDKNLFRFVFNNTINSTDVFGLKKCQKPPTTNGCTKVPDSYFFFDFSAACNKHDMCYGTCGAVQNVCDQDFLIDMLRMCQPYRDQLWNPLARTLYCACGILASAYYDGVALMGPPYFDEAQNEFCIDADENGNCPFGSYPAIIW